MEHISIMILKMVFHYQITSQLKNKKWRILEITKISHGPPSTIVCELMNLTEAFLTENHLEVRIREGRKDRKLEILRYLEIYEK